MGNWRKPQGEGYGPVNQGATRSYHRKPPFAKEVPSWEKKFCFSVGSVPWRKLLEAKRYMDLHKNVVQWDDSAGREAFNDAKSRFWAEINGLPCNISLPDPNIYIDDIDWNSSVDPELILDLEREPKVPSNEGLKGDNVVILGNALMLNEQFTCTGWGDDEWVVGHDFGDSNVHGDNGVDQWEQNYAQSNGAKKELEWDWGSGWDNSGAKEELEWDWRSGWDNSGAKKETEWDWRSGWDNSGAKKETEWDWRSGWDNAYQWNQLEQDGYEKTQKTAYRRKGSEHRLRYKTNAYRGESYCWSQHKTSAYRSDNYQMNRGTWRRKVNFS